jgi:predicted nucleic acid-binding protein
MQRALGSFGLRCPTRCSKRFTECCRDKFLWPREDLAEAAADIMDFATRVDPTRSIEAVPEDPDDNRVLECAVAAGSGYIVTGDPALLRLAAFEGIRILRVAEFMALIRP